MKQQLITTGKATILVVDLPEGAKSFLEKSIAKHGDKYDYSQSVYKNRHSKISIICPIHGVFEQRVNNHIAGKGCKKCGRVKNIEGIKNYHRQNRMDVSNIECPINARIIPLSKGYYSIVDEEDYERLMVHIWHVVIRFGVPYAVTNFSTGKTARMNRLVLNVTDNNLVVDHIHHNTLDNRKSQLRIATYSQNSMNTKKQRVKCSSVYKGVCWDKSRMMWFSAIHINNKQKYLGRFHSEIEAARAYDKAAIENYGEFCLLNFPNNKYSGMLTL